MAKPPIRLDYESQIPGAPRGFINRYNPNATPRSLIIRLILGAAYGLILWLLIFVFDPQHLRAPTLFSFICWTFIPALLGMVAHWNITPAIDDPSD